MIDLPGWEAWATLAIIGVMLVALMRDWARPDVTLLACLGALLLLGILTPEEAFAGLSNGAVLAVGALFVVAAGVQGTGALAFADRLLFPRSKNIGRVTGQFMAVTAAMSAFLNNTPLVAMLIPRAQSWAEANGVPASKLLIPLSFAAIVGGTTTLIGTSTNLLVSGLMISSGYEGLGLFDLAWAGIPAALGAILFFATVGHRLLPDRSKGGVQLNDGLRDCFFELRVTPGASLVGQTVEEAGLRALADAYLVHVRRGDEVIPSSPGVTFRGGDVLTFLGTPAVLDRLLDRPGLERTQESLGAADRATLPLYEAIVSPTSRLVGRSLRDVGFREHYNGVVLGIHRRGDPIEGALGRVPLQAGDLLLVEAPNGFDKRWNHQRDEFYLVAARHPVRQRPKRGKAPVALLILVLVIAAAALELAPIITTAFLGALAMIATGCLTTQEARRSIDVPTLVVIAAALGLGRAIEVTGLAALAAAIITGPAAAIGAVGAVAVIFIGTSVLTEVITNNAAAALMLGIGLAVSDTVGVPPEAFAVTVAVAASSAFMTPIGYQTNMMVMSAGGYRFTDFLVAGWWTKLVVGAISVVMIWLVWL